MDEKISVIVPIYNVEAYIRKCLDSIVGQTYTNLEIILVDDGSPDNCGAICDEYAKKDERIVVVHRENGGVSAARNTGLNTATGAWIAWVDPDDWIEPDMFEDMYSGARSNGADIVVCGRQLEYPNRVARYKWDEPCILNTEQALTHLLENKLLQNYLWDKLWKRELFENITFPKGRTFEDIAVIHRLFERAEKIYCIPDIKYHYLQHSESIISNIALKNRINYYLAAKQRFLEMRERWPQFIDLLEAQCVEATVSVWTVYSRHSGEEREKYREMILEMAEFSKKHYRQVLENGSLGLAGRIIVRLTPYPNCFSFAVSRLVGGLYKIKNAREL